MQDRIEEDEDSDQSEDVLIYQAAEDAEAVEEEQLQKIARLRPRHHLWDHKAGSYYIVLAFILGYDSMILFTNFFDRYGALFLLGYLIALVFIGFPLLYMEMTLGQFTSYNVFSVFNRMAPAMAGIGIVSLLLNFLIMVTDHTMMHHFMSLFSHTANIFTNEYPWDGCHSSYNDYNCRELFHTCQQFQKHYKDLSMEQLEELGLDIQSIGQLCYQTQLLNEMDDDTDSHWKLTELNTIDFSKWLTSESMGQFMLQGMKIDKSLLKYITWPSIEWIVNMCLAWAAVYYICLTGKRFVSNLARFTTLFTLAVLITFGVVFLFISPPTYPHFNPIRTVDWGNLPYIMAWSIICVILTLRLGQGGIVYLGSQYPFRNSPTKDCIVICAAAAVFPMLYTVVHLMFTDSYMMELMDGEKSKLLDIRQQQEKVYFYETGHRLYQMTFFLQTLRLLKSYQPFMVGLFSAMGILVSVANKVVRAEIIITSIQEVYTAYANRISRQMSIHFLIIISFIYTALFVCEDGLEIMVSLENFVYPLIAGCVCLAELFAVCGCYGGKRLIVNIMAMSSQRNRDQESKMVANITRIIIIGMWSFVIPSFIFLSLVALKFEATTKLNQFIDPPVILGIVIIFIIPVMAVVRLLKQCEKSKDWKPAFRPHPELWGPRSLEDRQHSERLERMYRTR